MGKQKSWQSLDGPQISVQDLYSEARQGLDTGSERDIIQLGGRFSLAVHFTHHDRLMFESSGGARHLVIAANGLRAVD